MNINILFLCRNDCTACYSLPNNLCDYIQIFIRDYNISDDDVYLEKEKERKEYVMNETGRIWQGTAKSYEALPWVFGQV